jgi:RraA family protein
MNLVQTSGNSENGAGAVVSESRSRIFASPTRAASHKQLEELRRFEINWIVDAMGFGLMSSQIQPAHSYAPRIAGNAVTVKTTPGDFLIVPWAVDLAGQDDILVVDGAGATSRAIWGDFVSARAKSRGCEGVVVNGMVRDVAGIEALELPVYSLGTSPLGPTRVGPGGVNVPVSCGGVAVLPGDVIVADPTGIAVIPRSDVELVIARARAKGADESRLQIAADDGGWNQHLERVSRIAPPPVVQHRSWND